MKWTSWVERLIGRCPVDHHVGEVVVVLDLGPLAEVLGVVDGQMVDVEPAEEEVVGLVVHPVRGRARRSHRPTGSCSTAGRVAAEATPPLVRIPSISRFCRRAAGWTGMPGRTAPVVPSRSGSDLRLTATDHDQSNAPVLTVAVARW